MAQTPPGFGSVNNPYVEFPWDQTRQVGWGGTVALVTITQSDFSLWNCQSADPIRPTVPDGPNGPIGRMVPWDVTNDPDYTDGHTSYNPPGRFGNPPGIIDKTQYLKDAKASPFNSGTAIYYCATKGLPVDPGGISFPDQFAWLDTGLISAGYIVGVHGAGFGSIEYYEAVEVPLFSRSPYNGTPLPSQITDWTNRGWTFTGQTRAIDTGEFTSPDGTTVGRAQIGQARVKVIPAFSFGFSKSIDYTLVNFAGSLAADGSTIIPEKLINIVFAPPVPDSTGRFVDINYSIILSDFNSPAHVMQELQFNVGPTPLPYPTFGPRPNSRYVSSTDIQEDLTAHITADPNQTAQVRLQFYGTGTNFNIAADGTTTAVPPPGAPPGPPPPAPPTPRYDQTRTLAYPPIGGVSGGTPPLGIKFNAKGFIDPTP